MACLFFRPTTILEPGVQGDSPRPPLGEFYGGGCAASGDEDFEPSEDQLRDCCNMGYAEGRCRRLPPDRAADAVRFTLVADNENELEIRWSIERDHRPVAGGSLRWDRRSTDRAPTCPREDVRTLAEAYRRAYLRAFETRVDTPSGVWDSGD